MASPRDLDRNFKDENKKPEDLDSSALLQQEQEQEQVDEKDDDTSYTVYRERTVDAAGVVGEKLHRVPTAEWPAYEQEHGF